MGNVTFEEVLQNVAAPVFRGDEALMAESFAQALIRQAPLNTWRALNGQYNSTLMTRDKFQELLWGTLTKETIIGSENKWS